MLSLWPELYDFAQIAPVLLRLALGGIFFTAGLREVIRPRRNPEALFRLIGIAHLAVGGLLIIGLWLQLAALLAALEIFFYLTGDLTGRFHTAKPLGYLALMLAVAISLIFLGPGFLAFDLPL